MISYNKMSKKAKREYDRSRRTTWVFSPMSRVKPSKKVYSRKAAASVGRNTAIGE